MDAIEALLTRRMVRGFTQQPVTEDQIDTLLKVMVAAPSGGNRQPWRFVVAKDSERKRILAKAADNQTFIADAGVIIVALGDPEASPRWFRQDPMIAVEHMVLAATALGYGTCWI